MEHSSGVRSSVLKDRSKKMGLDLTADSGPNTTGREEKVLSKRVGVQTLEIQRRQSIRWDFLYCIRSYYVAGRKRPETM